MAKPKRGSATPSPRKEVAIRTDGRTEIQNWAILGLDLSLSRTGYATLLTQGSAETWVEIGSYTPGDESKGEDTWARAQAYALGIGAEIERIHARCTAMGGSWGLLIVMETPDPENSYLMGLNQVIQTNLWNPIIPFYSFFSELRRMFVNAQSLRSIMGLPQGSTKADNQKKAWSFLPSGRFQRMDTDACDAVLLVRFAAWGIAMLQGRPEQVPRVAQIALARDGVSVKVKAVSKDTGEVLRKEEKPNGLLYNPDLWTKIEFPKAIVLKRADADRPKPKLDSFTLQI